MLNWPVVFLSFSLGLVVVYVSTPPPKVVEVYPTPDKPETVYGNGQTCYRYESSPATCPVGGGLSMAG